MRVLILLTLALACPAAAEHAGAQITPVSLEYCTSLAVRFAATPMVRQEPHRALAEDGQRLCRAGHVRSGVTRLRRALKGVLAAKGPAAAAF